MEIFQCKWADCHEIFNNHDDFVSHFKVEHEQWFISSATHEDDGRGKLQKTWTCQWRHGCKKQATRLENFRIHVRTHTGEKPFICDIAGCSKGFSNASDCNKHRIRAHTLECYAGDCTKRYKDPSSLRKHIIAIHGKDEYERLRKLNKIKRKNIPIFLDAILPNSSSSQLTIDQINTLQRISAEMIAENHYPSDAKTIPNTPRSEYSFFATPEDISRSMSTMSYSSSLNSLYSETFTSISSMSNTAEKIGLCASIENIRNNSTYYQQLVHKMGFGNATLDRVVKYLQDVEKNGNNNQDTHIEIDENDSDCLIDLTNSYNRITDGILVRMTNSEGPFNCKTIKPEQVIEIDTKESLYVTTSLEEGLIPAFEILELQRRNGVPPERVKVPEEIRLYAASLSENDELDKNVPRSQVKTKASDVDACMQQLLIKANENNPDQFNDL